MDKSTQTATGEGNNAPREDLEKATFADKIGVLQRRVDRLEVALATEERNYETVRKQRDELLAALKPIIEQTKPAHIAEGYTKPPTMKQWEAAQAAIAKVEGSK